MNKLLLKDIFPFAAFSDSLLREKEIKGIKFNAQNISPGDLFIAYPFSTEEQEVSSINEALNRGASVILKNKNNYSISSPLALIVEVENIRKTLAKVGSIINPCQPDVIVGITGTSGKSSVASFTRQLWDLLGFKAASLGTLGIQCSHVKFDEFLPLGKTTPTPLLLHYSLDRLSKNSITHVAMEVSSQGLDNFRVDEVNFKAAAFTNLDHDHLDYHGTREAYFQAKARLFKELLPIGALAILNKNDPKCKEIEKICKKRQHKILWIGFKEGDFRIDKLVSFPQSLEIKFRIFGSSYETVLNFPGEFHAENFLFALAITIGLGGNINQCLNSAQMIQGVKGRMEPVVSLPNGAHVYIDYAHKPQALEKALKSLRMQISGKITLVFGCGGNRDWEKRGMMGLIAHQHADTIIVTDDNPRKEDPKKIRAQILAECPKAKEIPSRREAIREAISTLGPNDGCLIAGKGHEKGQIVNDDIFPFDEYEEISKIIKKNILKII